VEQGADQGLTQGLMQDQMQDVILVPSPGWKRLAILVMTAWQNQTAPSKKRPFSKAILILMLILFIRDHAQNRPSLKAKDPIQNTETPKSGISKRAMVRSGKTALPSQGLMIL
jgi:hypothetical protein